MNRNGIVGVAVVFAFVIASVAHAQTQSPRTYVEAAYAVMTAGIKARDAAKIASVTATLLASTASTRRSPSWPSARAKAEAIAIILALSKSSPSSVNAWRGARQRLGAPSNSALRKPACTNPATMSSPSATRSSM